jgi:predicted membrane protein
MKDFQQDLKEQIEEKIKNPDRHFDNRTGRVLGGLFLVGVGVVLMAKQFGVYIPSWVFTWKMLLIGIGIFLGARHSFQGIGWMFPLLIGSAFLIDDLYPELTLREYIWPLLIICFGIFMIFRPRRRWSRHFGNRNWEQDWNTMLSSSSDDTIDATSIFGGTRKNIISKDFKGGDITTFFGGTDINLSQADITGPVTIDVTQVFGGTKLIVPAHWTIKSDVVCVFGSIEDKRPQANQMPDPNKVLRLDGTCLFGGIEIKNF